MVMVLDLYYNGVNLIRKCFGDETAGSNAGFGGDNNLLASLKSRRFSEVRSFIT